MAWSASSSFVARSTRSQAEGRVIPPLVEAASATAAVAAVGARPSGGGRGVEEVEVVGALDRGACAFSLFSSFSSSEAAAAAGRGAPAEKERREEGEKEEEKEQRLVAACALAVDDVVGGIVVHRPFTIVEAPPCSIASLWSAIRAREERTRPRDDIARTERTSGAVAEGGDFRGIGLKVTDADVFSRSAQKIRRRK